MNEWKQFHKTSFLEKEELYSNLNMEDIADSDSDCMHATISVNIIFILKMIHYF